MCRCLELCHRSGRQSLTKFGILAYPQIIAYSGTSGEDDIISDQSAGELPRLLTYVSVPSGLPQQAIGVPQLLEAVIFSSPENKNYIK